MQALYFRIRNSPFPERKHMLAGMTERIGPAQPTRLFAREWMVDRGLNQKQLAARLRFSAPTLSKLFNGKMDWNPEYMADVAHALGIEPGDLFRDPATPTQADLLRDLPPEKRSLIVDMIRGLKAG